MTNRTEPDQREDDEGPTSDDMLSTHLFGSAVTCRPRPQQGDSDG